MMEYNLSDCITFYKIKDYWGELSPLHGGFPMRIAGMFIPDAETLYQCMKFSGNIRVQRILLDQTSPMRVRWEAHRYETECNRLDIMEFVTRLKYHQHLGTFRVILEHSEDSDLVFLSPNNNFWGTNFKGRGQNHLGRIWMKLRSEMPDVQEPQISYPARKLLNRHFNNLGE